MLPPPQPGPEAATAWVEEHLAGCFGDDEAAASPRFRGGQTAADGALAAFEVAGYAAQRNEVLPEGRRGASALSPYIRHGLLDLPTVWEAVGDGPVRDVSKFRDELLWQEYARHVYGRLGRATQRPLRYDHSEWRSGSGWDRDMACLDVNLTELERDGWVVNQARMWLASHWTVRKGVAWRDGEDHFFRHLLDGSRAANRIGWQWTAGLLTNRPYGFSRRQVMRRAPGLCAQCPLESDCPIQGWPDDPELRSIDSDPAIRNDPDPTATAGPQRALITGDPEVVWLTAESLGDADPALAAHPASPAVFVFDTRLLRRLRLASKRLVFLTETLADLAQRRSVEIHAGDPIELLSGRPVAVTFTPVPGWRRISAALDVAALHPWRWLRQPHGGSVGSFSAWRRRLRD